MAIQSHIRDPDKFPTFQLFLLAIVRLAEPIALTSIFPYAWPLVRNFNVGKAEDASFYAGILISTFSLSEALTGMYWGGLSDRIGRKPVLLLGCFGTMVSMIIVGFATNIWVALIGRALGGLLNGNIGVIQTMVGELVTKPEHEPRAYSVMPFVWSIGSIIGPCIGGTLADPATSFPGTFSRDGIFGRFPYLLPNIICASLLLIGLLLGYFMLEETHPDSCHRVENTYVSDHTPLIETVDAIKTPAVDLRAKTYGTFNAKTHGTKNRSFDSADEKWDTVEEVHSHTIFTKQVIAVIVALGIFTYHSMSWDHLLPIFLEDSRPSIPTLTSHHRQGRAATITGGLGFTVQSVGIVMSFDGLIALFVQTIIFPFAASMMGITRLFLLVTTLHPIIYILITYLTYIPSNLVYPGLYTCLTIRNILQIIAYPLLLIMIKEATPHMAVRGKVNGMAASAGAACRTIAPPISGLLYAIGSKHNFAELAWYGSAVVASVGAVQCFMIQRRKSNCDVETTVSVPDEKNDTTPRLVDI